MKKIKRLFLFSIVFAMFLGMFNTNLKAKELKTEAKPTNYLTGDSSLIGSGSYYKYFKSCSWIERDGAWSLSITPTDYLRMSFSSEVAESAYLALYDVHKNDKLWNNTSSMKEQFKCHFWNAKPKSTWNIEPWRTSINSVTCN